MITLTCLNCRKLTTQIEIVFYRHNNGKCGYCGGELAPVPWSELKHEKGIHQGINISELKNLNRGATIYIIGSGSSMNYIPKTFFDDKLTIGINDTFRDYWLTYLLAHHKENLQEAINSCYRVVASEWHNGFKERQDNMDDSARKYFGRNEFKGRFFSYSHRNQTYNVNDIDLRPIIEDRPSELFMSCSTPATAMHFAAHLGAAHIILCGVDGVAIDGKINYDGYNKGGTTSPEHISKTRHLINIVAIALRESHPNHPSIHSLNPFVDLSLEGHRYQKL